MGLVLWRLRVSCDVEPLAALQKATVRRESLLESAGPDSQFCGLVHATTFRVRPYVNGNPGFFTWFRGELATGEAERQELAVELSVSWFALIWTTPFLAGGVVAAFAFPPALLLSAFVPLLVAVPVLYQARLGTRRLLEVVGGNVTSCTGPTSAWITSAAPAPARPAPPEEKA